MATTEDTASSALMNGLKITDSQQQTTVYVPFGSQTDETGATQVVATFDGSGVLHCPHLRNVLEARPSPFVEDNYHGGGFVSDEDRVDLQAIHFAKRKEGAYQSQEDKSKPKSKSELTSYVDLPPQVIRAGPRAEVYHNPLSTHAAIVTCGGLCPGLNDIVRGIVLKCLDYGVPEKNILGIRYGFKGFYDKVNRPIQLSLRMVEDIQLEGGTVLGTSRERADIKEVVKRLDLWKIDMLFIVGGPGSHVAAQTIQNECHTCKVPCCIVAVPKSIDNDILLIDKTFGFDTAIEEAQKALLAAKVEATSGYRGIGLVKLMGRRSGFIAVQASLASGLVDICLIPEVPFRLDTMLAYIETILERKGHAVVCVAEGAAQDLMRESGTGKTGEKVTLCGFSSGGDDGDAECDDSELVDVGYWLKTVIKDSLHDVDVKYIDPSYLVRSVPTASNDRIYCRMLANGAVHAAFAGYTGVTVGLINTHFVYLPIPVVIQAPRKVDVHGELWNRLRSSIGQPNLNDPPPPRRVASSGSMASPASTPGRSW